jgi:2-C-methyl-D-erythritol 4-phosphate cytidylyltransferase/2-C-methyl-D-erythritol 2,4-cyclodiphosphate synthase
VIGSERVGAILAAGGTGLRAGLAKQWVMLGGETVLRRAARALVASGVVDEMVAVVPAGEERRGEADLGGLGVPVRAVAGGAVRSDSVRAGLSALGAVDVVLVHDAARPFATPALARAVAEAAAARGAALAAVAATDTVKRAGLGRLVKETLDRRSVWLAQTPQGFRTSILRRAFEAAGASAAEATDECQLVERIGEPARARAIVEPAVAMGVGYDVHAFAPGRKLVLGGVQFEGDGLLGHSDADICAHAICDAILGAAGLGDIGRHFPDTDPRWKGISSLVLLREIAVRVATLGWSVGNCDVTLAARRPKIAPRAEEMRARLAEAMGISPGQVNVKGTTGEGLGFVGRGEGIAAHAVALLVRR